MRLRWFSVLVWLPALAMGAPKSDRKSFEQDLEQVFADKGLTAEEAARRASKQAPTIARKTASVEVKEADASRARQSLLPIVAGKATYTRLSHIDPVTLPLGPMNFVIPFYENSYDVTGSVTVNVSDYFVRDPSLIGGANAARDAAARELDASQAGVAQQAREIYYEWLRAQLQVLVAKRQLVQVEATRTQIKALVDVQRASTADLLRIEAQLAQARQLIDQFDSGVLVREEQLRLLIGADKLEKFAVGEDVRKDIKIPEVGDLDTLAAKAVARRNEVKALDNGIRAKEAQRRSEATTLLPKLSAFAIVDYARPNPRYFPQPDEFKFTWVAGLQASWVINESLAAHSTRDRYAAEADELRADRKGLEQQVRLEVLRAMEGVRLAKRSLDTTQQGLDAAEESYRVRKDLFGANRASVVEIVDAETALLRARISALDARIDLRIALSRLAFATGQR